MTFTNLAPFNQKLRDSGKTLTERQFMLMLRKVGLELLSGIVFRTRVKTGRARGNWQVSINNPITTETENVDTAGSSTISSGGSVIATLSNMTLAQIEKIFITNNVKYITKLEEMDGMVNLTLARIGTIF